MRHKIISTPTIVNGFHKISECDSLYKISVRAIDICKWKPEKSLWRQKLQFRENSWTWIQQQVVFIDNFLKGNKLNMVKETFRFSASFIHELKIGSYFYMVHSNVCWCRTNAFTLSNYMDVRKLHKIARHKQTNTPFLARGSSSLAQA